MSGKDVLAVTPCAPSGTLGTIKRGWGADVGVDPDKNLDRPNDDHIAVFDPIRNFFRQPVVSPVDEDDTLTTNVCLNG